MLMASNKPKTNKPAASRGGAKICRLYLAGSKLEIQTRA
jgi:hypothetical protein